MTGSPVGSRLKDNLQHARQDLTRLTEELRVQAHLGNQELRDAWNSLDPALQNATRSLDAAADKITDATERARLQAHLGLAQLRAGWPRLEAAITDVVGGTVGDVKEAGDKIKGSAQQARVQAHLAAMEADELAQKARHHAIAVNAELEQQTERAIADLRDAMGRLRTRIRK